MICKAESALRIRGKIYFENVKNNNLKREKINQWPVLFESTHNIALIKKLKNVIQMLIC